MNDDNENEAFQFIALGIFILCICVGFASCQISCTYANKHTTQQTQANE
jgi:hypothetical protein